MIHHQAQTRWETGPRHLIKTIAWQSQNIQQPCPVKDQTAIQEKRTPLDQMLIRNYWANEINKITRKHPHQPLIQRPTPVTDNSSKLILWAIIVKYSPFNQPQSEPCKTIMNLPSQPGSTNPIPRPPSLCLSPVRPLNHPFSPYLRPWKSSPTTSLCLAFWIRARR